MVAPESPLDESAHSPLRVGQVLVGKYRVERQIGRGGMGVVLAATHLQLEHQVAIKVLRRELLEDDKALTRLLSEARAAAKIRSEHVARVLDVGTLDNGSPFIVMEYLDGEDLADLLDRQGALEVPQAVQFLLQSCEALAEVHAAEMVHRDLKPGNLFIARLPDGSPSLKIVDFGISKHIGPSAHNTAATTSAQVLGSPYYMPPEQMRAEPVDERSDIWSLGAILFEMLTARPPFLGETLPEVYAAVLAQPAPRVTSLRPDVPPGLDEIVQRCLDKDPAQRFCDVADLAEALAPFGNARSAHSVERVSRILSNPNLFRSPPGNTPKVAPVAEPATARGGIAVEPALKATPVIGIGAAKPASAPVVTPALVTPAIASQARRTSSSEVGPLSATGSHPDLNAPAGGRGARVAWAAFALATVGVVGVLALRSSGEVTPEPMTKPLPLPAAQPVPASSAELKAAPPAVRPEPAPASPAVPADSPELQTRRQALTPAAQPQVNVAESPRTTPVSPRPPAEKSEPAKKPEHEKLEKRAKPKPVAAKSSAPSAAKSAPAAHSETRPAPKPVPQRTGAAASSEDPWNPNSFGDRH